MKPFVCVDTETTGIPGKIHGWNPRIIEIGAVFVNEEQLGETFNLLVKQSSEHLRSPHAAEAMRISGITIEELEEEGISENEAARRFSEWLHDVWRNREKPIIVRAFNQAFDFQFLRCPPWSIFDHATEGKCIMLDAMSIMGPAGGLQPKPSRYGRSKQDPWKWPRVSEALAFFIGKGYPIKVEGQANSALADEKVEAQIAIAIEGERCKTELERAIWEMMPAPVLRDADDIFREPYWMCPSCGGRAEEPEQIHHRDTCPVTIGMRVLGERSCVPPSSGPTGR